jgi:hypothetical protein
MEWSGNPEQSSTPATAESASACSIPHMDHALETTGGNPSVFTSTRFSTLPMRVQIFVARQDGRGQFGSASWRRAKESGRAVRPSAKRLAQAAVQVAHRPWCRWHTGCSAGGASGAGGGGAGLRSCPPLVPRACEQAPTAARRSTPEASPSALQAFGFRLSVLSTLKNTPRNVSNTKQGGQLRRLIRDQQVAGIKWTRGTPARRLSPRRHPASSHSLALALKSAEQLPARRFPRAIGAGRPESRSDAPPQRIRKLC